MNSNNTINHNKDRTKTTAAIPMVGAIVTAALLLSGLSLISSSYQPATAQQLGMTTDGGGGGGATTGGGTEGGATGGATPQDGNATAAGVAGGGGNDSLSQIRMHLESARTALQNNDTQGAMLYLELADNALGGAGALQGSNMTAAGTTTGGSTNMTTTGGNQTAAAAGGGGGQLEGIFGGGEGG
jgi:hypothetical protein